MISNLALIDNPKARALGFALKNLPNVMDIRFFPALAEEVGTVAGDNALTYVAVTRKDGEWRRAFVIVPAATYEDESQYQTIADLMAERIAAVYEHGESAPKTPVVNPLIVPQE